MIHHERRVGKLRHLIVNRVALVDAGANEHSRIEFVEAGAADGYRQRGHQLTDVVARGRPRHPLPGLQEPGQPRRRDLSSLRLDGC